jgi:hypothetical protein
MPEPSGSQIHVDAVLTNLSVAYIQAAEDFIAAQFAPVVPVQRRSDRYYVYLKGDWFRDEAEERAPATTSAGGGYGLDNTPTYYARKWAYHVDVDPDEVQNADTPLRPFEDAQAYSTQQLLIRRERLWATTFFGTGVWGTDIQGVAGAPGAGQVRQWNEATATPIEDIDAQKASVLEQTGREPNTLVVGYRVHNRLKNHPSVLDRIKYTQRASVTPELLAALFGVQKYLVGKAVVNTAARGAANAMTFIHGRHALLAHVAPNPGLRIPSAAYTFAWTGLLGAGAYGNRIRRFTMEERNFAERIEGEMAFDQKVVGADLGVFIADAVAS